MPSGRPPVVETERRAPDPGLKGDTQPQGRNPDEARSHSLSQTSVTLVQQASSQDEEEKEICVLLLKLSTYRS